MRWLVALPELAKDIGQLGTRPFSSCRQLMTGRQHTTAQLQRGVAQIEQVQGASGGAEPGLANLQVTLRALKRVMAQQRLDSHQVHTAFQKMGGETMAQGVDASAFLKTAFLLGYIVDFLRRADVQWAIATLAKENPGHRLIRLLVSFQFPQKPLGENRVAILFPLALFDPDHHPFRIDIGELEMDQFGDSKSCRVCSHQQTAIAQFDRR